MAKTTTRILISAFAAWLAVLPVQGPAEEAVTYLYTFGSREGINPPKVLNRRAATLPLGAGDFPYGIGFPVAVTTDALGRIWITDSGTLSIHVFDRTAGTYREIRKAGGVPLQQPAGIVTDIQGRIYVVDSAAAAIYVFDRDGEFDRSLMKRGQTALQQPTSIAVSDDGRTIYVTDLARDSVVELNREGDVDNVIHLPPELHQPVALSVVRNQIYVLGENRHRVGMFTPAGILRGEMRWDGVAAPAAFAWSPARHRFFVANPRWMVVHLFDEDAREIGAFGQRGDGVSQVRRIDALYVDKQNRIYEVASHEGKVLVFQDMDAP